MKEIQALIVDDVSNMRNLLASSLRSLDVTNILEAMSAKEAIELYKQKHIDVVFLDLNMPDIDGFEALKQIRNLDPMAFVVIVSGENYIENVKKAIKMGAKGFIVKPYQLGKIKDMLTKYAAFIADETPEFK